MRVTYTYRVRWAILPEAITSILCVLALLVVWALGCGPARNALHTATPTAPPAAPCTDGARRCNGLGKELH